MLRQIDEFIGANKQLGYTTGGEFILEAVTEMLQGLGKVRSEKS